MLNIDLEKQLSTYIDEHPESRLKKIQVLELSGKLKELKVYRLPIELLRYNIRNGRFAAEYRELKEKEGHELDPNKKSDAKKIRNLLLVQDTNATDVLKKDLKRVGQRSPGIITADGYLINGNRRRAIIQSIHEETGEAKWEYIEVSILPKNVDERDLWRIEAGLQFSRDERLDYGPINKLLKFREGVAAGLTETQIAATLFGGFSAETIKDDLERLTLIENYLEFIGEPKRYKFAQGKHEHFINLQKFIKKQQKLGTKPQNLFDIIKFSFDLIQNDITHLNLRHLNDIMKHKNSKNNLLNEIKTNETISTIINPTSDDSNIEDGTKLTGRDAPTIQLFFDSFEMAEAAEEKNQPKKLLKKALRNLQGIYVPNLKTNDQEIKTLAKQIDKIFQKIKTKIEG